MARAVLQLYALDEQKSLRFLRAGEDKLLARALHNAVLHLAKLKLKYLPEMMFLEAAEDDDLINTVHEFGREFSLRRLRRRAIDLLVYVVLHHPLAARGSEPD